MATQIEIKFKRFTVTGRGDNEKDAIKAVGCLAQAPTKCGNCGGENLVPKHKLAKGKHGDNAGKTFNYYDLLCLDCQHTLGLGQHDNADSLFLKESDGWQPPYQGGGQGGGRQQQQQQQTRQQASGDGEPW